MVADQVNNEALAGDLLARVQVRDLPVDRAVSDSQAYRALSAVRVGGPWTNLETLSHLDPAIERS